MPIVVDVEKGVGVVGAGECTKKAVTVYCPTYDLEEDEDGSHDDDEEGDIVVGRNSVEVALHNKNNDDDDDGGGHNHTNEIVPLPNPKTTTASSSLSSTSTTKKSILWNGIEYFKYLYSFILLLFSVTIVMVGIFQNQTSGTSTTVDGSMTTIPPIGAFVLFWFLIVWLAIMEGGQGCIVGLQYIDPKVYEDTHRRTVLNTKLVLHSNSNSNSNNNNNNNNNLERFIIGRQFLAVFVIFAINTIAYPISDSNILSLNEYNIIQLIFLDNGVALIITTLVIGQLTGQINSAQCQLDYINNYFMVLTSYASLFMEQSGLMHAVYLFQFLFTKLSGTCTTTTDTSSSTCSSQHNQQPTKKLELSSSSQQPTVRSTTTVFQLFFFWIRVVVSVIILGFSFAVTLSALVHDQTKMWSGIPSYISMIVLFVLIVFVGIMEGMQIALFAVEKIVSTDVCPTKHPMAYKNCQLIFPIHNGNGNTSTTTTQNNFQAFLIGRQICVTGCMFVVARITAINVDIDNNNEDNIFGVNDTIQRLFNTGMLGAIITTITASLIWRIIASSFPILFLSNPIVYCIIHICLLLEQSGLCSSAWILAFVHKSIVKCQPDEVYYKQYYYTSNNNNNSIIGSNTNSDTNETTTTLTNKPTNESA